MNYYKVLFKDNDKFDIVYGSFEERLGIYIIKNEFSNHAYKKSFIKDIILYEV